MTDSNTLRRLNWLWKYRHTHDGDTFQEQITIISNRLDQDADTPSIGSHEHGMYTVLVSPTAAPKAAYAFDSQGWFDPVTNRTYLAYLGFERDLYVTYMDHQNGDVLVGSVEVAAYPIDDDDDHGSPSICVDLDGYIHIVWGAHNTAIQYAKSTNKQDISAWTTGSIDALEGTYHQITVDPSTGYLYLIARPGDGSTHGTPFPTHSYGSIRSSTDNGSTWSAQTEIVDTNGFAEAVEDFYPIGGMDFGGDGFLHFVWSVSRGTVHDDVRTNIYHAYYDPATGFLHSADGTNLGTSINSTDHTSCLAATRNPIGQLTLGFNGSRIGIIYTAGSDDLYVTVWDGTQWAETDLGVNAPSTEEARAAIWGERGVWKALVPVDNGTYGDIKLFGAPADGDDWTEIDTLLVGNNGEGYSRVSIVRNDGPVRALAPSEVASFAVTSATAADLQNLYAIVDDEYHIHEDLYYSREQIDVIVDGLGDSLDFTKELVMQDGVTAPPVPVETEARDDWLYQD